ncbi:MAG: bacteriohemerythrin [Treponema sp.]|jgi:hemerythrin|nr:bacteriohemerythrin [Treponema sp.]
MINKSDMRDDSLSDKFEPLITWSEIYVTGIELIDNQHKELVNLTNLLYKACLTGNEETKTIFQDAMHKLVDYVRFHFTAELAILERINYPKYNEHKAQHDELVRTILVTAKDYEAGKKLVPNTFVRTLADWVFGHIAVYDKSYASYVADQKKRGLLDDKQIAG